MYSDLGSRGGLMGLEMPFEQMVQKQLPPQQPRPQAPPQMAPQQPQQVQQNVPQQQVAPQMGQQIALGQPQQPQQPQHQGFNGDIAYGKETIQVRNGMAEYNGEKYIVSDDGKYVVNVKGEFEGIIQGGKFIPATPELIDQLRRQGVFESEQSQGMAPQEKK